MLGATRVAQPDIAFAKIDIFFPLHGNGDHGWSAVGTKC
jgi:hypothetical protein